MQSQGRKFTALPDSYLSVPLTLLKCSKSAYNPVLEMQSDQYRLSRDYFSLSLDITPISMDLKLSWFLKQLLITDIKYVNNSKSRSIVFLKFLSPLRSYSFSICCTELRTQNVQLRIQNLLLESKTLVSIIVPTCAAMDKLLGTSASSLVK